jgi:hypothetical protein
VAKKTSDRALRPDEENSEWTKDDLARGAAYVNDLGDEGEDRARSAYGDNHARPAALKAKYDPTNLFHLNQNIKPIL